MFIHIFSADVWCHCQQSLLPAAGEQVIRREKREGARGRGRDGGLGGGVSWGNWMDGRLAVGKDERKRCTAGYGCEAERPNEAWWDDEQRLKEGRDAGQKVDDSGRLVLVACVAQTAAAMTTVQVLSRSIECRSASCQQACPCVSVCACALAWPFIKTSPPPDSRSRCASCLMLCWTTWDTDMWVSVFKVTAECLCKWIWMLCDLDFLLCR